MKRLLTFLLLVCGMTTGIRAQTAQLTRDGYLVKTFTGASSLSSAISAAASKGDIIVLSSGSFSNPGNITKSVSIYGQGFENSTAIGNARTYIAGKIEFKLMSEGALDGIHLEGLYIADDLNILTDIGTTAVIDDFTVKKCHSGGVFFYQRSTNVKLQNCKFDRDVRTYPGSYTTTMQVDNCYIEGNLFNFADGSNVIVNNSLIHNNHHQNYSAATSFNNCIIYKNILNGSSATKCIFNQSSVSGSTDNCWMGVNNGDIYVSEGEDGSYGESKSFAVKDTYVGTDNTPVGLQGGIGWNKTPTIPSYLTPEDLPQDAEGYYLLDGKMAWLSFAALVNGGTYDAKAKMTADIDLGNDQTMIGDTGESTSSPCFSGIFDGQGYTLTVAYTGIGSSSVGAPFAKINGATIKNLHVKGSLSSAGYHPTSIVSDSWGTSRLEKVWGEVDITGTRTGWVEASGLVGCMKAGNLTIEDCLFTGTVNGSGSYNGCFIGYIDSGSATITNSLSTGTFSYSGESNGFRGTHTNCYVKQFPTSYPSGVTKPTDEELADGTTTTALNNGRSEVIWVQDAVTNKPMLATFANAVTLTDVNNLTALSAYAGKTCKVTYSRSFTEAKSSTVCLPFAFAKGSVGTFYTFTGITKSGSEYIATMTVYPGDNLVANTPYLFTPSATGDVDFGGTYTLPASITAGSTESGDWTYLGTYETISWPEAPTGIYGFSAQAVGDIQQGEFVKVGAYVRIKPMRCYLKYKNGLANYAGARGMTRAADEELPETIKVRLIGADGEVTAIGSLQTKTGEVTFDKDAWYSLDGRRIEGKPTMKGIYVNNGKKIVVK